VKETSSKPKGLPSGSVSLSTLFSRVTPGELSAATRQLSILLGAGVTLVASLDTLISQMTNPALKRVLAQIKESVNEGKDLAFSLSQHPKVFSPIYINMVRAGEASGSLDLVLDRLAEFSEHQQALKGRIRAAMAYPIFMSCVGALILFFLVSFVVPNITKVFADLKQTLPLITVVLIGASDFLKSFWWAVVVGLGGCLVLLRQLTRTTKGRYVWDEFKLRLPVFGIINVKIAMARFGRTLGSLLQNGVPLLTALQIVRNIVNNVLIAEVIDHAVEEIEKGKSLANSLAQSRWFPPIPVQMIAVGEQSGELENMLNKVADIYEKEVESQTMAMTSMLEPFMILFMGLVVGFIVISILLPIFEMNQLVR
jgi:general secretion pathway protein F